MKNVLQKLLLLQAELKAPKSQRNNFGNYNYRSCEDILEALKPLLAKHKAVITISDTLENIGERYYVKATATLYDIESEESISNTSFAREEETKKGMDGSQITGASSSYSRKYALNGLFGIDDTKDSDTTNTGNDIDLTQIKKSVRKASGEKVGIAKELFSKLPIDRQASFMFWLEKYFKVKDLTDLDENSIGVVLIQLQGVVDKIEKGGVHND